MDDLAFAFSTMGTSKVSEPDGIDPGYDSAFFERDVDGKH
jgi:hypothetical protein